MSQHSITNSQPGTSAPTTVFHSVSLVAYTRCTSEQFRGPECLGYTMGKTLGSGTYAKVKAAYKFGDPKMIAVKILNKKAASKEYLTKFLPREIKVMQELFHPNIIQLYRLVETEKQMYFMLELAENGDLLDYINAKRALKEREARYIFKQMAGAIAFCHSKDIVHRDLKCENILLSATMQVKIGDFGFALNLADSAAKTPCGSYSYAAPELFTSNGEPYDGKKADIWSLGVILFAMVCGRLPFGDDAQIKKSQHRQVVFTRQLTPDCVTFINSLLNMNAKERLDSTGMLIAQWVMAESSNTAPAMTQHKVKYTLENSCPAAHQQMVVGPPQPHPYVMSAPAPPVIIQCPVALTPIGGPYHIPAPPAHPHPPMVPLRPTRAEPVSQQTVVISHRHVDTSVAPPEVETTPQVERLKSGQRPIVAKIGAYGRKIADAVKHVGHHRHTTSGSSSSSSK